MRTFILSCALALGSLSTFAQGYQFTDVVKVPATPESSIHGNLLVLRHDLFHGVGITPYGKRDVRSL